MHLAKRAIIIALLVFGSVPYSQTEQKPHACDYCDSIREY